MLKQQLNKNVKKKLSKEYVTSFDDHSDTIADIERPGGDLTETGAFKLEPHLELHPGEG